MNSAIFTSQWGLHRGFSQRVQQLRAFVILRKRRRKGSKCIRMPTQALQRHSLTVIGLEMTTTR